MSTPEASPPPADPNPALPPDATAGPEPLTVTAAAALAAAAAARAARSPETRPAFESVLERLAGELLRQQRTDRRWRVFFRLAWLGLAVALVWAVASSRATPGAPTSAHTALVEVRGEIAMESDASAELLIDALKAAFEDAGAQAVVLRINSPGGSPVQAGIVHDEILRLKAKHGKKVYAVVEEMCASGAYYIAVAADEIYVDKASLVGSIGVLMDGFGFTDAMAKLGVERRLLTAGENKGMLDPFSPQNERQKAYAQAMIDQIHRQFIQVVKTGRGARLKETPETFSGLFWNGEEAVKLGLVDHTGGLDFVAREIVKAEDIVDYTQRENVAERLAKRFGASMGQVVVRTLRDLPSLR